MKKFLHAVLVFCLVYLFAFTSCACAEQTGFGMVNAGDVALRKDPRGQKITRLQKGTSVWITDAGTDSRGELWYHVRTEEDTTGGAVYRKGWVKAEFIDAGSALWHDIQTVRAGLCGMIALKTDGTVLCAGHVQEEGLQGRYAALRDIRQIGVCSIGWGFFAVDGNGVMYRDGTAQQTGFRIRIAGNGDVRSISTDNRLVYNYEGSGGVVWAYPQSGGDALLPRVTAMAGTNGKYLFLTDDGKVYAANENDYPASGYEPDPDWETWTDAVSIDAALCSSGTYVLEGHTLKKYVPAFAAVRRDGTVLAAPSALAALTADWQGMRQIALGPYWVLGLKQDGTVLAAGIDGGTPPDVSGWTDIAEVSNGLTYCVGVKNDGTLVFAGSFEFKD